MMNKDPNSMINNNLIVWTSLSFNMVSLVNNLNEVGKNELNNTTYIIELGFS